RAGGGHEAHLGGLPGELLRRRLRYGRRGDEDRLTADLPAGECGGVLVHVEPAREEVGQVVRAERRRRPSAGRPVGGTVDGEEDRARHAELARVHVCHPIGGGEPGRRDRVGQAVVRVARERGVAGARAVVGWCFLVPDQRGDEGVVRRAGRRRKEGGGYEAQGDDDGKSQRLHASLRWGVTQRVIGGPCLTGKIGSLSTKNE